jgi:ABC-2 type transport system ATP-binding protein
MIEPAIEFRNVSLHYRIMTDRGVVTFKEWVIRTLKAELSYQKHWALSNVSFTVDPGQALGIIGSNGAGKSTLLKIAAGILQPSEGEAVTRGQVAPIIELGAGFEFELAGRENVLFNGALLGRSRSEMLERFDDIVRFAELDGFIESSMRTYSTGMIARLAFAIATTVDADILLLDEILAVGDQHFRDRCAKRIREFRDKGVTIVVVSHDMSTVAALCDRALWLDHGKVQAYGPVADVVAQYQEGIGRGTVGLAADQAVNQAVPEPVLPA